MDNQEFERLLDVAALTKKEFADMNELHKNSVTNWKQRDVPGWVQLWLENYIKAKKFDEMIDTANKLK